MIGETIDGKYLVRRLIGGGGMGSVYEAEHLGTGRRVAVKVINPGDFTKNEGLVRRFQREAKASGIIESAHIAQVLDTGCDATTGLPFMVMEYLAGEDAQELFGRTGPLPPDVALRIVAQAAMGLSRAHAARVVHRDIKPANIFLSRREGEEVVVKVLDFGIAKLRMEAAHAMDETGLTRTGTLLGSPLYMSPEQARGSAEIDHRADIWSLGIVLYQALAGRTPYQHVTALGELILAICGGPPPPVQDFAPWVAPEVAALVHGSLRLDPAKRFQSADELLEVLRPLLPGGSSITEAMLVELPETARQSVAPRLDLSVDEPLPAPEFVRAVTAQPQSLSRSLPEPRAVTPVAATNDGMAQTTVTPERRSRVVPILGAVVAMAIGAIAAVTIMGPSAAEPTAIAAPAAPAPPPAPAEAPAPKIEPAREAEAAPPASASAPATVSSAPATVSSAPASAPAPAAVRPAAATAATTAATTKAAPSASAKPKASSSPAPLDTSGFGDRK